MEAQLLGTTAPDIGSQDPPVDQIANAALCGALMVHAFAAILSFIAAFFLIRYKLAVATREERKVESGLASSATNSKTAMSRVARTSTDTGNSAAGGETGGGTGAASCESSIASPPIWSSNPHVETVGPFRRGQPPTHLLEHCHSLCMWLAVVGFALALVGVICFAWSRLALSGGVFASVCMAVCLVTSVAAIFWPASSAHR